MEKRGYIIGSVAMVYEACRRAGIELLDTKFHLNSRQHSNDQAVPKWVNTIGSSFDYAKRSSIEPLQWEYDIDFLACLFRACQKYERLRAALLTLVATFESSWNRDRELMYWVREFMCSTCKGKGKMYYTQESFFTGLADPRQSTQQRIADTCRTCGGLGTEYKE